MMKRRIAAVCALAAVLSQSVWAADYTFHGPEQGLFARSTSDNTIYVDRPKINVDRSKNTALIPPAFGSATSYLTSSGTTMTPTLIQGGSGSTSDIMTPPTISGNTNTGSTGTGSYESSFTLVTPDLYYAGGYIGSLKIPSIGVDVKIYQGTDDAALRYGVGHFENTSIWEGNVAIAGHNRGVNSYFGKIHTLKPGATIQLTTKIGTRQYQADGVAKIAATDVSVLSARDNDIITLITCVRDQPEYRWCVQAKLVR